MGDGFQFIDIVFFAMIAGFLVLRLRSVLGRREGHRGGHRDPFATKDSPQTADDNVVSLPQRDDEPDDDSPWAPTEETPAEEQSPLDMGIAQIRQVDPGFVPKEFVEGARMAFEMILNAFAAGDGDTLRNLVSDDVLVNFLRAIEDRDEDGQTLEITLVGIESTDLVEAELTGGIAQVTVKFVSQQISVSKDAAGNIVDGDPTAVTEIADFWTFARDTRSRDPNWSLVATRSLD